jgi:hypothetical protein
MAVSVIGGGNRRKPQSCHKSQTLSHKVVSSTPRQVVMLQFEQCDFPKTKGFIYIYFVFVCIYICIYNLFVNMLRSYHASFFVALSYVHVHVIAHFVPGAVVAVIAW